LKEVLRNARLLRERWDGRVEPDDLDRFVEDGLLRLRYWDAFPIMMEVAPELAHFHDERRGEEADRLLDAQSRRIMGLLTEVVRLTAHIADLELVANGQLPAEIRESGGPREPGAPTAGVTHEGLLRRAQAIEIELYDLQAELASALESNGRQGGLSGGAFAPSEYLGYRKLVQEFRGTVGAALPPNARVLVVSRGDDELLELDGRTVGHFPQDDEGTYAGFYPTDSAAAIAHLEELRKRGAEYLVFPSTATWWLERYGEFGDHLRARYAVALEEDNCLIFSLREG
jgi:hypothetical protein